MFTVGVRRRLTDSFFEKKALMFWKNSPAERTIPETNSRKSRMIAMKTQLSVDGAEGWSIPSKPLGKVAATRVESTCSNESAA